ncbi:MAG: polynucleotide adenylyltransferase PcnB [Steroidobacteraceae bacterium]
MNAETLDSRTPIIIPRAEHPVSRSLVAPGALKVLYRLRDAGYQAFLVGGCVRDILLGITPKDFDVGTNALPDEVRSLFRNSRLIGRRFRLAHVRFGDQIIEVATFRAGHLDGDEAEGSIEEGEGEEEVAAEVAAELAADPDDRRLQDDRGRLLRDNIYGSIDDDVWRRDFTCNALYYNIDDFSIWDYVGGFADVQARTLRLIGDPETRYREDPVRMLRAVRFQAKLGFTLEEKTHEPIKRLAGLIDGVPPARLLDEFQKMYLAGFACRAHELLIGHGLFDHLFPATAEHLAAEPESMAARLIRAGLRATDRRASEQRTLTPMFLFAVLLFGPISAVAQRRFEAGVPAPQAIAEACDEVVRDQCRRIGIPKRFSIPMREMLALQPRFHRRGGRRALALLTHPRFRAAYDFLLLRAEAGAEDPELAAWWTELQTLPQEERLARVEAQAGSEASDSPPSQRRRRRGGRGRRSPRPAE